MQHQLYGLRGKAWVAKYKQLYEQYHPILLAEARKIKREEGAFTYRDMGALAMKHRLPLKTTYEFLEEDENGEPFIPVGTYDKFIDSGHKARDVGVVWN